MIKRGKGGKKAQFYIIAAVIIIAVLIGIFAIKNYAKTKRDYTKIYDLGGELGIETGNVYDYGIYQGYDTNKVIRAWAREYSEYTEEQGVVEDWFFVYGDKKDVRAVLFSTVETGKVGIYTGGGTSWVEVEKGVLSETPLGSAEGGEVNVTFHELDYEFKLKKGENFFFVIRSGEASAVGE